MHLTRHIISGALLLSLLGPSAHALAENETIQTQRLRSDCASLRTELDSVNREIAALKQSDRNVRNEYRLREKMADAEALARKLTEAERLLRTARPPAPTLALPPPMATPQDGVVELEAKADLLADQANRFTTEADSLARTAEEIRNRQALRRRASNWDRDPFVGFEGSKRSLVVQQQRSTGTLAAGDSTRGSTESTKSAGSTNNGAAVVGPPSADTGSRGSASTSPEYGSTGSAPGPTSGPTLSPTPSAAPSSLPSAATPLAPSAASKPGLLPRTLLDPASLADIRQSLGAAGSLSDPDAIEAAVTALRQRARALQEQASALRARARQH
jgi:hypothetical protein